MHFLTVKEFNILDKKNKLIYKLRRNPWIFFFILGPLYFIFLMRFNQKIYKSHQAYSKKVVHSIYLTNLILIVFYLILFCLLGYRMMLLLYLPSICLASTVGTWLFFVQHNFPDAYFATGQKRTHTAAALKGSSYYKLPKGFAWLTGYIGYHHVHHLYPKIPLYNLKKCFNSTDKLQYPKTYTLKDTFRIAKLGLYDTIQMKLISWDEYKELYG